MTHNSYFQQDSLSNTIESIFTIYKVICWNIEGLYSSTFRVWGGGALDQEFVENIKDIDNVMLQET